MRILFIFITLISVIFSSLLLKLFKMKAVIEYVKNISLFFLSKRKNIISFKQIYLRFFKINKLLNIKSCLLRCISLKIIYSYYGYDLKVCCGVKIKNRVVDGHAWLKYQDNIVFEEKDDIESYIFSFEI